MITPSPAPTPRRRRVLAKLGTRELVIAFAIVEAVALLWLVTRTSRRRAATTLVASPIASPAPGDSTSRPATHVRP